MKTLVSVFLMTFSLTTLAEQATQQISLESFNEMAALMQGPCVFVKR